MIISAASSSTSGATLIHDAGLEVTNVKRRELIFQRITVELGSTRWASPPPGASWRTILTIVILGDLGLLLLALDMGFIHH
ncbi:MAG: hypothetical protein EKK62_16520 [Acidimicrobiia bacterium]|nr:MAG: hypothetical protein EKK62_16520 [Acidimicrobiia bacterium]